MAGYIGSKSSVTQVDGYNQAEADAEFVNDPNSVITVSGSNVGIGTSSPRNDAGTTTLEVSGSTTARLIVQSTGTGGREYGWYASVDGQFGLYDYTASSERMRIDSSGNLLVGKTSSSSTTAGAEIFGSGYQFLTNDGVSLYLTRPSTDGEMLRFLKGTTTVGSIGVEAGRLQVFRSSGAGLAFFGSAWGPMKDGAQSDNQVDIGGPTNRMDDIYATNGTIQTSDRNEKQDIEVLSDAEQRVAVACKGLLRKFRWQDAVAEKGDDARIHFGIIAQDLQDAFAAEGLDAGRYAMFISSTWWEATETYTDDDGVEQTRTDTYETQAEAPEGATERTRLGVRYPELLAFIIGAM